MAPTAPFCIEEAFKACQHQKRPSDRPIDIISVISHVDQPSDRLTILNVVDSSGKARIVYYGTQQQRRIVKTFGVTHGDILRFNRLSLRTPRDDGAFKYEFHHPMHEQEDGKDFCRLARTAGKGALALEILPPPMAFDTDARTIKALGNWFIESSYSRIPEIICQKQQISSIQPGLTLHLDANVDSVVMADSQHSSASKTKRAKRRRQPGCYVVLRDSTGVISLLIELHHHDMVLTVKSAHENHCGVGITHARAIHTNDNDDGILLVPTNSSRIQLIDPPQSDDLYSTPAEVTEPPVQKDDQCRHTASSRDTEEVVCSIRDIVVKGISLTSHMHRYLKDGIADNLHVLLRQDDLCYSNVTLELVEVPLGRALIANAEGGIVEKLLGDISVEAWKANSKMQAIVISFLRGLLEEKLELVWNLEHLRTWAEKSCCVVVDVRLAVLHDY